MAKDGRHYILRPVRFYDKDKHNVGTLFTTSNPRLLHLQTYTIVSHTSLTYPTFYLSGLCIMATCCELPVASCTHTYFVSMHQIYKEFPQYITIYYTLVKAEVHLHPCTLVVHFRYPFFFPKTMIKITQRFCSSLKEDQHK